MQKKIFLITLLLSLLVLTACSTSKTTTTASGFIGGSDGLAMSFVADQPPAKVLDGNQPPFPITLLIENKGEHDIASGDIVTTIDSIDYGAFQIKNPNQKNTQGIEAVARDPSGKTMPGGKSTEITYSASYKPTVPASQTFTIGMNMCYKYQTQTITKVCLKKDVTSRAGTQDVCKVEDQKVPSNSAGPIQITSISERPSGKNQLSLVIQVENKGKGEVYDPSFLNSGTCLSSTDANVQDKVHVKIYFPDNSPALKCTQFNNGNEGTIRLVQGKQRFDCTLDTSNVQATIFEKQINVDSNYVYKEYMSKQVIVDSAL